MSMLAGAKSERSKSTIASLEWRPSIALSLPVLQPYLLLSPYCSLHEIEANTIKHLTKNNPKAQNIQ